VNPTSHRTTTRCVSRRSATLLVVVVAFAFAVAVTALLLLGGCGSGASGKTVRVPDVTGLDWAEAQTVLAGAKLRPVIDAQQIPRVKALTVVSQKPAAKTEVPEGTLVTLVVASGGSAPATKTP
jgi:beta-lactam-binding protein with PASTA domain